MTQPNSLAERVQRIEGYDPKALPVVVAREIIEASMQPVTQVEQVALTAALGRVLAQDIISPIDVPAHDNSAMDGYALRSSDIAAETDTVLTVVGTAFAGDATCPAVGNGQCLRIMTGAVMPAGCDTVVPQELVHALQGGSITLTAGTIAAGDNRRLRGEDLQRGVPALTQGRRLRPVDLGLIASLGIATVPVFRKVKVAYFSTGDELRSLGEQLNPSNVFDANRYTLLGMLSRLGCELVDLGLVPDEPTALQAAFARGCEEADAIITSGGVSVGQADHTKHVMASMGDVLFWTIAMRPGRPLAFGHLHHGGRSTPVFGLPGNPVAVMVTFYFLVRTALQHCEGEMGAALPYVRALCTQSIRKKPGRTEYQRAWLGADASGQPIVRITGAQGSGILSSMSAANAMIVLEHAREDVSAGELVDVVVFDGLV